MFSGIIGTLQYWVESVPMLYLPASYGGFELRIALGTVLGVTIFGPLGVLGAMHAVATAPDDRRR